MPIQHMVVDATMSLAPAYAGMLAVLAVSLAGILLGSDIPHRVAEGFRSGVAVRLGRSFAAIDGMLPRAGRNYAANRSGIAK